MALRLDDLALLQAMLLECVCATLDAAQTTVEGYPGCPPCKYPTSGEPAHDSCCGCGGQLNTWIERVYPYATFPDIDDGTIGRGFGQCGPPKGFAADLVVSVLRCAPSMNDDGSPPSPTAMAENAWITAVDLQTALTGIVCCLDELVLPRRRRPYRYVLGEGRINTPEGGCVAVEARVTVDLGKLCGCPGGDES